jgi:hypothetical protein
MTPPVKESFSFGSLLYNTTVYHTIALIGRPQSNYMLILDLFHNTLSTALIKINNNKNIKVILNNQITNVWNRAVVDILNILSQPLRRGTKEYLEKFRPGMCSAILKCADLE